MKTIYKLVEWSYPTSTNAKRFGFPSGCWTEKLGADSAGSFTTQGMRVSWFTHPK